MSIANLPSYVDVVFRASHVDFVNKNAVKYTIRAAKQGADSWVYPYRKPQLVGHDKSRDPIGRITAAKIVTVKETVDANEPKTYLQLTARITDAASIEKVLDGRYNTVSVGSRTTKVICSECDTVITEEGLCEHKKGSYNDNGDMIYWIIDQLEYVEDSFVNEPADEWAGIDSINIGVGWVAYQDFMDNRDSLLSQYKLEDHKMSKNADSKLTTEQRDKLADSVFCGPGRSFPAHDSAHITAALSSLKTLEFSDEIKAKLVSALYSKGKRYGIVPTQDDLVEDPNILFNRLEDEWTDEEVTAIADFFKENPDADLPETENTTKDKDTQEDSEEETTDIAKMKVGELRELVTKLTKDLEDASVTSKEAIDLRDKKITTLETELQDAETVSLQKEDEINKFVDETTKLEKKLRDAVISNIIDLQMTDNTNEDINGLREKYAKRQTESLVDTLQDLRTTTDPDNKETNSEEKVEDSTLKTEESVNSDGADDDASQNTDTTSTDNKYAIFDRDRSSKLED